MSLFSRTIRRHAVVMATAAALAMPIAASADTETFSDSQLQSFAVAVAAINEIALKWQPQVRAAESEDQAATMLEQADTEMRQAIENTEGIGLDEYQQIMEAAQADPELKSEIDALLQDAVAQ
jgi:TolA-binding protein